ncbi:hypothetical protein WHR41_06622 [Cladosporium halotolerans]|uniref:ADF-H domain-containing protein n=1 Tax=Cladosporium halotolerans TaxID=1052096 RepID=A0AB34KIC6_9PEZI
MQSGISASQELQTAFNDFVSSPSQRGLLAGIENEALIPLNTIPLQSDFNADLSQLQSHLSPNAARYVLLKVAPGEPDGFVAVTYVPNSAPVREKMLFASTRLTLVRELGIERFRETLFATEASELTAEGWARHEKHSKQDAPLTEEEAGQAGLREAEAQESGGTTARKGHVGSKVDAINTEDGLPEALAELMKEGSGGLLVQLYFNLPDETLRVASSTPSVSPAQLSTTLSQSDPRLSFYSYPGGNSSSPQIVFIYTCPSSSKLKERMMYSTSKKFTQMIAEQKAGVVVTKSLEATEFEDLSEEALAKEFGVDEKAEKKGFARPKRPGRR